MGVRLLFSERDDLVGESMGTVGALGFLPPLRVFPTINEWRHSIASLWIRDATRGRWNALEPRMALARWGSNSRRDYDRTAWLREFVADISSERLARLDIWLSAQ